MSLRNFSFSFTALLVYSGVWALQTEWNSQSLRSRAPLFLWGAHSKSHHILPLSRPSREKHLVLLHNGCPQSVLHLCLHVLSNPLSFMLDFFCHVHSTPCQTSQRCGTSTLMLQLFSPTRTRTTSLFILCLKASVMPKIN